MGFAITDEIKMEILIQTPCACVNKIIAELLLLLLHLTLNETSMLSQR